MQPKSLVGYLVWRLPELQLLVRMWSGMQAQQRWKVAHDVWLGRRIREASGKILEPYLCGRGRSARVTSAESLFQEQPAGYVATTSISATAV